ncbi:MAG: hypothetical protein Q9220_002437 [cf. Caloplaca sp. 1 TL-2023]
MAITFADGVILGADSRTTTGAYIANRVTDKLTRVSDTIWCCRSGSAADTQAVADVVSYYLGMYATMEGEQPTVGVAAGLFQEVVILCATPSIFLKELDSRPDSKIHRDSGENIDTGDAAAGKPDMPFLSSAPDCHFGFGDPYTRTPDTLERTKRIAHVPKQPRAVRLGSSYLVAREFCMPAKSAKRVFKT